jgi:hypothetical protein
VSTVATAYEFKAEPELPPVERWSIQPRDHSWAAQTPDVQLAPLGLPSAEQRREEYRVLIDVDTDRGQVEMPLPLRAEQIGTNGSSAYRVTGTQYHLTLTFELSADGGTIHWQLDPGGRDARGRAAVIDLLIALSGRGVVVLTDPEFGALAQMHLSSHPLDDSLLEERRFLTDILIIEAWSGRRLALPDELDEAAGNLVAQLTHWMRTREMSVRFIGSISGVTSGPVKAADELRLHEYVQYSLFGIWVPLGRINYRVPVRVSRESREGDTWRTWFQPTKAQITATITPPHGAASIRRLRSVDSGELPRQPEPRATDRRKRAQAAALALVGQSTASSLEEDDAIRDKIRRQWPT